MRLPHRIRFANNSDTDSINSFLQQNIFLHRHLDWHEPLYWIQKPPFLLMEYQSRIDALLSFAPDPEGIAWARTFAVSTSVPVSYAWNELFSETRNYFTNQKPDLLAAVCITDWFADLLLYSGFQVRQNIVTFMFKPALFKELPMTPVFKIRRMDFSDLDTVAKIDQASFEPLWQTPFSGLETAFNTSFYSTLLIQEDQIIAYLIATEKAGNAHLARIAVLPQFQNRGVASSLINDFIAFSRKNNIKEITLNTQSDNLRSISLYEKLGFMPVGENYPVLTYQM